MKDYQKLLLQNKAWAQETDEYDPEYFARLAASQTPQFLWIGCADSRVSTDRVTDTMPGEMFVHRNIANMVVADDVNMLSVLQYAVEVLKVKHVIVCGHYGCGGVKASMGAAMSGPIGQWLEYLKDSYRLHAAELDALEGEARFDRFVELNTIQQTLNLARTALIQNAWQNGDLPMLHGWVFDLKTGLLQEVTQVNRDNYAGLQPAPVGLRAGH